MRRVKVDLLTYLLTYLHKKRHKIDHVDNDGIKYRNKTKLYANA